MARAVRSNNRIDLILLLVCALVALIARALPDTRREPTATGLRRTFLSPMVMLQEWAETSRHSMSLAPARTAAVRTSTRPAWNARLSAGPAAAVRR